MRIQQNSPSSQKLQKILAQAGLGSRRDMEVLIESGKVTVNGKTAVIGARVVSGDVVKIGPRTIEFATDDLPRVLLYYKPEGEIVSRDDPENRPSVFTNLPELSRGKWLSIGRLDYNTCGLLIFTTSGDFANRFAHPRYQIEREYQVRILGQLSPEQMQLLCSGIRLSDGLTRLESITEGGGVGSNHWYQVIVKEGKNRIVRRMFEEIKLTVSRLMRTRFGPLQLPHNLRKGRWQELDAIAVGQLMKAFDMPLVEASRVQKSQPQRFAMVEQREPRKRSLVNKNTRNNRSEQKPFVRRDPVK